MKKQFVKPEIKGIRLRENILAGSGGNQQAATCIPERNKIIECGGDYSNTGNAARERVTFDF